MVVQYTVGMYVPVFNDTTCRNWLVMKMNALTVSVCGKWSVRRLSGAGIWSKKRPMIPAHKASTPK
jgi:hypothetical protein